MSESNNKKILNVPNLRFKEFRLGDISSLITKGTTAKNFVDDGIKFIKIESIKNGNELTGKIYYINENEHNNFLKRSKLEENDILFSIAGALGIVHVISKNELPSNTNQALSIIRLKDASLVKYVSWFLQSSNIQKLIKEIKSIGAQPNLSLEQVSNFKILIPENNKYIENLVDLLDLIEERIHTQNKIIEDYILLRKKLNNQFFDSLINKIKFKSIYKIASEGGTPDTSKANYYNGGQIPFVKIENLYDKYLVSCNNYITQDGLKNSSAWLVPKNSILLSNGATIGETAINKIDVATKQGILGIIPSDDYDVEFLYYLFKSNRFVRTLKRITTKGTMDAAYLKDLNQENIYVCSKEDWKKHIYLMSLMDLLIDNDHKILSKYKMQKNFLLNNLFI